MGITGTDVAREASDMVITDDNFATIVHAVEEGRRIYSNIQKGACYLLSSNFAEVAILFTAVVILDYPIVPLLALQILFVNLVTDEFPALGLTVEPAAKDIMRIPSHLNYSMPLTADRLINPYSGMASLKIKDCSLRFPGLLSP